MICTHSLRDALLVYKHTHDITVCQRVSLITCTDSPKNAFCVYNYISSIGRNNDRFSIIYFDIAIRQRNYDCYYVSLTLHSVISAGVVTSVVEV